MQDHSLPANSQLNRINVEDIDIGMYMSLPDRPWLETPFLYQGFVLDSEDLLQQVKQECQFIYVDNEKSLLQNKFDAHSAEAQINTSKSTGYEIKRPVERAIKNAYKQHKNALLEIKETLKQIQFSEGINVTKIRKSVKSCVVSIMDNPNAMLWLGKLRNRDNYTAEHCLNVGILAIALGRHLGLDQKQLETLGLCGMLHDVGKMLIDQNILNKPGRLTAAEFDIVKSHCELGKTILDQDSSLPKEAAIAAYSHHERIDGKGYPAGIHAGSLNLYTRIISIVDTYDAITSNRCYDKSRPATEAMKILFAGRNTQFDTALVEQFIECLGIYPIGSLVELHSGEIAVVIDSNKDCRLHPKVSIVRDEFNRTCQPLIVNTLDYKAGDGKRTIKRILDENDFDINLNEAFVYFGV